MNYQYNMNGGNGAGGGGNNVGSNTLGGNSITGNNSTNANIGRNHHAMSMIPQPTLMASSTILTVGPYKHRKDLTRESVLAKYQIIGYIAAGTYGKVYKAKSKRVQEKEDESATSAIGGASTPYQQSSSLASQSAANVNYSSNINYNYYNNLHVNNNFHLNQHLQTQPSHHPSITGGVAGNTNSNLNSGSGANQHNPNTGFAQSDNHAAHSKPGINNSNGNNNGNPANAGNANSINNNSNNNSSISNNSNMNANSASHNVINSSIAAQSANAKSQGGNATSGTEAAPTEQLFAIKKFKNDNHSSKNYNHDINGNEIIHYTGISQSAIREMSICREISNKNITKTIDILLENKSIYIVSEFCEHDLLQIIHYHSHPEVRPIPERTTKSLIWQILNGVLFLHKNWIFHRDLKPANIMVTSNGVVKIGDLGLARKFNNPLQSLYTGDKVVVTIWYRAPELLLGARNYTPAIDLWAVGCILAELLSLRPIFKGEEAKMDINNKKSVPFQTNQFQKIVEILGTPTVQEWPSLNKYPEYGSFKQQLPNHYNPNINTWYKAVGGSSKSCLSLIKGLLEYDPIERLTAENALVHPYFLEQPKVSENAFDGLTFKYPKRRIYTDDNDIVSGMQAGKRHGFDDAKNRKRAR